jgi:hypothetical protein
MYVRKYSMHEDNGKCEKRKNRTYVKNRDVSDLLDVERIKLLRADQTG